MARIKFGDRWLQVESLLANTAITPLSAQENSALQFYKGWLNGQQEFSFKTSGSTGVPKEITFSRTQLEASANLTINAIGLNSSDVALLCLPVENIAGAMMIVRCILAKVDLIITKPSSNPFFNLEEKVTFIAMTPYQLKTTLETELRKVSELRIALIGGAEIPQPLISKLNKFSTTFYATFGMTETISHIALRKINGPDCQDYYILLDGITASVDNRKCLIIYAPHLNNPIATNDIIKLYKNGFKWLGRYDRVVNSGGLKILVEELESKVADIFVGLEIKNRFFITGMVSHNFGTEVVLIIEGESLEKEIEHDLMKACLSQLGKYRTPKSVMYIPKFEETESGKVDYLETEKLLRK